MLKKRFFGMLALILGLILVFGITACDDESGDDESISINGWKFSGYNDRNNGGTSTISISQDGNKLIVAGNLTKNVPNDPCRANNGFWHYCL